MASSGFGPYHSMRREDTLSKWIGAIPTPWAMVFALGLGVLMPQPELYHTHMVEFFSYRFYVVILIIDAMITTNSMILDY